MSAMRELPAGTVTFLFTDIEGSTRLLHELGDAYVEALAELRRVLREAFGAHRGVEVDTQGDAFFYAFARASDAGLWEDERDELARKILEHATPELELARVEGGRLTLDEAIDYALAGD
jgi:class 3 adenylate cyclase